MDGNDNGSEDGTDIFDDDGTDMLTKEGLASALRMLVFDRFTGSGNKNVLGKVGKKKFLGMQDGDIHKTHSNINLLKALTGFEPKTNMHEGISQFVKWYRSYY